MKKLVLCEFAGRRKKVIFETQPGQSDVSALKKAFIKASETDKDLRDRLANSTLVFQHINLELCPQPIDIDDDDIIEHKSIVTIVFTRTAFLDIPIELSGTSTQERYLDTVLCNDMCVYEEATIKEVSNSSIVTRNEDNSTTELAKSSDMSLVLIKAHSPETNPSTSKAHSPVIPAEVTPSTSKVQSTEMISEVCE